jgi:hypothetical protein
MSNQTISQREQIKQQIVKKKQVVSRLMEAPAFYQGFIDRGERLPGTDSAEETRKVCPMLIDRSKLALASALADLANLRTRLRLITRAA